MEQRRIKPKIWCYEQSDLYCKYAYKCNRVKGRRERGDDQCHVFSNTCKLEKSWRPFWTNGDFKESHLKDRNRMNNFQAHEGVGWRAIKVN